jgi:hypothetical protein
VHFRPDSGDALAASGLAQKLLFQAELFVQGLRDDAFAQRVPMIIPFLKAKKSKEVSKKSTTGA